MALRSPWCHGAAAVTASLHAATGPRTPALRVLLRGGGRGRRPRRLQPLVSGGARGAGGADSSGAGRSDSRSPRSVTDAAELWSTCFTADSLAALVGSGAPGRARKPPAPPTAVRTTYEMEAGGLGSPRGGGRRVWTPFPELWSCRPKIGPASGGGSGSGSFGAVPGSWAAGDQPLCPVESPFWPERG